MRLFIAIHFDTTVQKVLIQALNQLQRECAHGSFTWKNNLHTTLSFLGECNHEQEKCIIDVMRTIPALPFDVHLSGIHTFTHNRSIVWAGFERELTLYGLANRLNARLADASFPIPDRPFTPHVTLARQVIWKKGYGLDNITLHPASCNISHMELMWSHRVDGNLVYTPLYMRSF